ncbi:hypothetical protein SSP35_09_00100 [Streptomyces sp. NBRC 110611]|nr:hypothetical protein SSP35_09_00100 [Streptomyces sp. NBRC 110611]
MPSVTDAWRMVRFRTAVPAAVPVAVLMVRFPLRESGRRQRRTVPRLRRPETMMHREVQGMHSARSRAGGKRLMRSGRHEGM